MDCPKCFTRIIDRNEDGDLSCLWCGFVVYDEYKGKFYGRTLLRLRMIKSMARRGAEPRKVAMASGLDYRTVKRVLELAR